MPRQAAGNTFAWWVMGGSAVLLGIAIVVYAVRFPVVSNCPDDWADFGSYLAGVSALIIGFATVLLLLHNVRLLREQVDIGHRHTSMQDQLIREQRDALQRQERAVESAEAERAMERLLHEILRLDEGAWRDWEAFKVNVGDEARRIETGAYLTVESYDAALRSVWIRLESYPNLLKLRGVLGELQQRFAEAEERRIASQYWAAWISGALPKASVSLLFYDARLDPNGAMARWVRDAALMRYTGSSILLHGDHSMGDLRPPFPAPGRQHPSHGGNG